MKKYKSNFLMLLDLIIVNLSFIVAVFVRMEFQINFENFKDNTGVVFTLITLVYFFCFSLTKTNRSVWDRISVDEGIRIFVANMMAMFILLILKYAGPFENVPGSIIILTFLINTLFQEVFRFSYRVFRTISLRRSKIRRAGSKRILIYGAGNSGALIAHEIINNTGYNAYVVGFIDDNPALKGKMISNHIVFGDEKVLDKIVEQHSIDEIIVAMPSETVGRQKNVLSRVYKTGLPAQSVTSAETLLTSDPLKNSLKRVDIVDLLQRKEIVLDDEEIKKSIYGKSILVTGAGGSIGSELVRQILKHTPSEVTLIDISENSLYSLQQELVRKTREGLIDNTIKINVYIGSIRDFNNMDSIFSKHKFNLVFHAAAHKHVPLMETSPQEAIKNNVFGTRNLIECANKHNVDKFVNISTDKAVNPTNVMGATKRFNEMLLQSQNNFHTKFVAVRFGNVLGSNGSVVPLFKKQIENGGPVTVTHKDITRFFMTIPEAVSLVLQAETYAKGGEIFVLDMGEPVKILDMAKRMIELSGFTPGIDMKIEFSGLRPGEKLYEELLMAEEGLVKTNNKLIFIAEPILYDLPTLHKDLEDFENIINNGNDIELLVERLKKAVPTFKPDNC